MQEEYHNYLKYKALPFPKEFDNIKNQIKIAKRKKKFIRLAKESYKLVNNELYYYKYKKKIVIP